jgi:[ribosomal protein S5]-alanine N-acetyltransferase
LNSINNGLETSRLIIRNFKSDDLDTYHRISNTSFGESPYEQTEQWMDWTVRNYTALANLYQPPYGDRAIVLKETGELIGAVGYAQALGPFDTLPYFYERAAQPPTGLATTEIGLFWSIAPEHRGNGYAGEGAQALIDYAFNHLWMKHIVATTEYDNSNSQAVMRKLGMTIQRNPYKEPFWFQIVGILENPNRPNLNQYQPQEETQSE